MKYGKTVDWCDREGEIGWVEKLLILSHSLIVCGKMRLRKRMVRTKELGRIAFLLVIYSAKVVETIDLISPGFLMRFSVTEKALSSNLNSRIQCMATVKCVENAFDIASTAHNTKQWRTQNEWKHPLDAYFLQKWCCLDFSIHSTIHTLYWNHSRVIAAPLNTVVKLSENVVFQMKCRIIFHTQKFSGTESLKDEKTNNKNICEDTDTWHLQRKMAHWVRLPKKLSTFYLIKHYARILFTFWADTRWWMWCYVRACLFGHDDSMKCKKGRNETETMHSAKFHCYRRYCRSFKI